MRLQVYPPGPGLVDIGIRKPLAAITWVLIAGLGGFRQAAAQRPATIELVTSSDTWVDGSEPETAHGADSGLVARFQNNQGARILIGFDLEPIRGAHIESAQLHLFLQSGNGEPAIQMATSGILESWGEVTTWADQPERTATYSVVDVGLSPMEITWSATQLLRDTIRANGALKGLALSGPLASEEFPPYTRVFASRESGQAPPKLVVGYLPGAAGVAAPSPAAGQETEERPPFTREVRIGLAALAAFLVGAVATLVIRKKRRAL